MAKFGKFLPLKQLIPVVQYLGVCVCARDIWIFVQYVHVRYYVVCMQYFDMCVRFMIMCVDILICVCDISICVCDIWLCVQ